MTIEEIIERAKKVCFSSNPQDYIQFVGELAELKPEQLPANLDAAAESYSENRTGGIILDDEVKAFKAGAKWMREQMKGGSK